MAHGDTPGRTPAIWRIAFVAALVTCGASFAVFAAALLNALGEDSDGLSNAPFVPDPARGADGGDAEPEPLRFSGPLPPALEDAGLVPATAAEPVDLVFTPDVGPGGGVVLRTFVPVASYTAGTWDLTRGELEALARGETSFAALGGYGAEPAYAVAAADAAIVGQFLPGTAPPIVFTDYAVMRAAMADVSQGPFIALVPLDETGPEMTVFALEGVDPLFADLAAWPFLERLEIEGRTPQGIAAVASLEATLREAFPRRPAAARIVATGDILMVRCSLDRIRATGDWAAPFRGPVGGFLASADLALGSLDSSIQDIGEPYGCEQTTNLTAPAEALEALTVAGFDEVTLATNHAADCGQVFCGMDALTRTIELLTTAGIKVVGAGSNLSEALAPAIFTVGEVTIGVLGFDDIAADSIGATDDEPGTAPLDDSYDDEHAEFPDAAAFYGRAETLGLERFTAAIRALSQQVDVVIVQVQSGYEDTHDPSPRSIKALRAAVEAGADLVIGNQAHWAGAVEVRGGVFVSYALGNFVFDQLHTPEHSEGYLVEAILLGGRIATVRLHPYRIVDQHRPEFANPELRAKILADAFDAGARLAAQE